MNYYKLYTTLSDKMQNLLLEFHNSDMSEDMYNIKKKRLRKLIKKAKGRINPKASKAATSRLIKKLRSAGTTEYTPQEVTAILNKNDQCLNLRKTQQEALMLLLQNKKFISIDVECDYEDHSIITEIGLTILEDNQVNSLNIVVGKKEDASTDLFEFGKTLYVDSVQDIISVLKTAMSYCDVLVGHEIRSDKKFLAPYIDISKKYEFDTALISKALTGQKKKLKHFAAMFGVDAKHPHNAGNDSRYTMEALLSFFKSDIGENFFEN